MTTSTLDPWQVCSIPGCGVRRHSKKMCHRHMMLSRQGKPMDTPRRVFDKNKGLSCKLAGCWRKAFCKGVCQSHYQRRRFGRENWNAILRPRRVGSVKVDAAIRLVPEVLAGVRKVAEENSVSFSSMLNRIIERWYADRKDVISQGAGRASAWNKRSDYDESQSI